MRQPLPEAQVRTAVAEWAALFNAGRYFEAHEVLEHPWLHAREPEKTLLKGLIHAAVALYQYVRGNGHGARVKYASCTRYLTPYRTAFDLDLDDLAAQMDCFFEELIRLPSGTPPPPPCCPWPRARSVNERSPGPS